MNWLEKISGCRNFAELQFFVENDCWKGSDQILSAILNKYDEFLLSLPSGGAVNFGNAEFWHSIFQEQMDWTPSVSGESRAAQEDVRMEWELATAENSPSVSHYLFFSFKNVTF